MCLSVLNEKYRLAVLIDNLFIYNNSLPVSQKVTDRLLTVNNNNQLSYGR